MLKFKTMKTVILYASRHGATKIYAEYLANEIGAPCYSVDEVKVSQLDAEHVILGSAIYMGHLRIADWLLDYWQHIRNKQLALFTVSATDPEDEELDRMIAKSLPPHFLKKMEVFKMPGRIDKSNLHWWERLVVNLVTRFEKDPVKKEEFAKGIDKIQKEKMKELKEWLNAEALHSS